MRIEGDGVADHAHHEDVDDAGGDGREEGAQWVVVTGMRRAPR